MGVSTDFRARPFDSRLGYSLIDDTKYNPPLKPELPQGSGGSSWQFTARDSLDPVAVQTDPDRQKALGEYYGKVMTDRQEQLDSKSQAAAGITAALQQQANLLRQQRDQALERGLSATAAQYDAQLADIDRKIAQLQFDAQNNNDVSAWLRDQMERPFELAKAAAQAIDTAGAMAATEAAIANMTQAKLESDERLQSMLSDIGFEGLVGQIGIEAAQQMVAEESSFNEQLGVLEAQGAYQQEIADFQKDLAIAGADQIEATFLREDEAQRFVTAAKIRDALADAEYDRNKVEMAKQQALAATREEIGRQFGEGVTLPSESDFVMMALQSQWDIIAADLPDEQMGAYYDLWQGLQSLDLDYMNTQGVLQALALMTGSGRGDNFVPGELGVDFDFEDVAILRQMDAIIKGAYEEYRSVQAYQGSSTDADNRDPQNIAEAAHYFKTGEIIGPYGERAAIAMSTYQDILARWPGTKIDPPSYLRPLETKEAAKAAGRAFNSDHHAGGGMDIYFEPGSQNTQKYREMEAYLQTLKAAGVLTFIPLGANSSHNDHIHVSFRLPYGGQVDFVDQTAGFNAASYGNETLDQAVDASPGSYTKPTTTTRASVS